MAVKIRLAEEEAEKTKVEGRVTGKRGRGGECVAGRKKSTNKSPAAEKSRAVLSDERKDPSEREDTG